MEGVNLRRKWENCHFLYDDLQQKRSSNRFCGEYDKCREVKNTFKLGWGGSIDTSVNH